MSTATRYDSSLAGRGEIILLVDDDEATRTFLGSVLSKTGYQVLACAEGRAAVQAYRDYPDVSVVLMDMIMPELDGIATAREIWLLNSKAKIVGMSGYESTRFNLSGFSAFLSKPHTAKELLRLVRNVVDSEEPSRINRDS